MRTENTDLVYYTTVDAYDGEHPSGGVCRRLVDIETSPDTFGERTPEPDQQDEIEWWVSVLEPIHDWSCRAAELGLPNRPDRWDDLEDLAYWCRKRLAEHAN